MTRIDYEILARAFYIARKSWLYNTRDGAKMWATCIDEVADALAGTNPRFNESKFISACHEFRIAHEKAALL